MKNHLTLALLILLTGCSSLPKDNTKVEKSISFNINNGQLRKAFDIYTALNPQQQKNKAITLAHKKTLKSIASLRIKTSITANKAAAKGDWKKAIDLYRQQIRIITIDKEFQKLYNKLNKKIHSKKQKLRDDFLVIRAKYLTKELPVKQKINNLDPYDIENNNQLKIAINDSKKVSAQLLTYGLKAIHDKDVATARTLIPLANQLDKNNPAINKANKALTKMTQPLQQYIDKLSEQGIRHYSNEQYQQALKKWNEILYLDPNNENVQANKSRTEKVLNSLEELKNKP